MFLVHNFLRLYFRNYYSYIEHSSGIVEFNKKQKKTLLVIVKRTLNFCFDIDWIFRQPRLQNYRNVKTVDRFQKLNFDIKNNFNATTICQLPFELPLLE